MIRLFDTDDVLEISRQHLFNYTGSNNPIAVNLVYRLFRAAVDVLSPEGPPNRYSFVIRSAFAGPGVEDCFEFLTRAVSQDRFVVDLEMAPEGTPDSPLGKFYFEIYLHNRGCSLALKPGYFTPEFAAAVRQFLNGDLSSEELAGFRRDQQRIAEGILTASIVDLVECQAIGVLPRTTRLSPGTVLGKRLEEYLEVIDGDQVLKITLGDTIALHGRENIGGVVLGFKAAAYAINRLSPDGPPARDSFTIFSAFPGSGVLDAFEAVFRVRSGNRLVVDPEYEVAHATPASVGMFYFLVSTAEGSVGFTVKGQVIPKRFVELALKNKVGQLGKVEKTVFQAVKEDLAIALMSHKAEAVFDEV